MGEPMRLVVLDTETTGLDPAAGHRVVEIGCLELIDHRASGRTFQTYVNPEREIPAEAFEVHGLSAELLSQQPVFAEIVEGFLAFIGEARLVIHNAEFDLKFINAELSRLGRPSLAAERAIDTLALARRKFPGVPANLDALCRRFKIDIAHRSVHGALLDAELLAKVYLELAGGREPGLGLAAQARAAGAGGERGLVEPRPHGPSADELAAHARFIDSLNDPIWKQ